ncbi:MAG: 3-deoxy-D-manno-octulosonic acid transferase [Roseobacter sp.]
MSGSLGLAAYRAFSRRRAKSHCDFQVARPEGQLAWIHAAEPQSHLAIEDLARRLRLMFNDVTILLSYADGQTFEKGSELFSNDDGIILQEVPSEHPEAAAQFVQHWRPDTCLWAWGDLRPNLVLEAAKTGCPMILFDVGLGGFDTRRDRWLPEMSRRLLASFRLCLVRNQNAGRRLEALGVPARRIELATPLQPGGYALPCQDEDLSDLREILSGRPVWLASGVQEDEISTVINAHRQAMRLSHRLLLVMHLTDPDLLEPLKQQAQESGLRTADWNGGEEPEENVNLLICDDTRDLGLFYRVAPVSYLGSSLMPGHGGQNPFEAAALGSAVLYGPNVRRYLPFYTRLANAGAARIVKDAETLGTAVGRLIAPDQAAGMACAGWDVISEGAAAIDRLTELIEETLDGNRGTRDARP